MDEGRNTWATWRAGMSFSFCFFLGGGAGAREGEGGESVLQEKVGFWGGEREMRR